MIRLDSMILGASNCIKFPLIFNRNCSILFTFGFYLLQFSFHVLILINYCIIYLCKSRDLSSVESIKSEKTQPHIKVVVRLVVFDFNTSWKVFENDKKIIIFLQEEVKFSARKQDKLEQQYGDQEVQLRTKKLPKCLVALE